MVFPSLGCLTCKSRRVKCDSIHPTCDRCRKGSHLCDWQSEDETSLLFRSENAFAQGKARRPRSHQSKTTHRVTLIEYPVPRALSLPIESHAINHWVANFSSVPTDLLNVGDEYRYGASVLYHWNRLRPDSSLYLAFLALSLATFGQVRGSGNALEQAERFYAKSIIKTRGELKDMSNEMIDYLLVSTALMASYDTFMYRADVTHISPFTTPRDVGPRFWDYHLKGSAALLLSRQQQRYPQNIPLERAVRRTIIRICILQGVPVQEWLIDGTMYGEEGAMLELDSLMVRTASLRSKLSTFVRDSRSAQLSTTKKLGEIVIEAQELDLALEVWTMGLAEDWRFTLQHFPETKSDLLYEGLVHSYTTRGKATAWNKYRAVRIIVNGIRIQLLTILAQCTTDGLSIDSHLKMCHQTISSLATDTCYSTPIFFNTVQDESGIKIYNNPEIMPTLASILAWPLVIALSTGALPEAQKDWLQRRMLTIARIIGAPVLHSSANGGEANWNLNNSIPPCWLPLNRCIVKRPQQ